MRADFRESSFDDPVIGRIVGGGRYRVERFVGEGAMGRVYVATQLSIGRQVALKLLHPRHVQHRRHVRRFYREARAATRLTSQHVVQVHDFGVDDESRAPFIVMELLRGETLRSWIERHGPATVAHAARLLAQVARALVDAARAGIVHRDLKPANILLVEAPDGSQLVKVTDFGIAKDLANPETETLTAAGATIGTPAYMAPEQVSGGDVDHRTDLYALGCILYELLSGRRPFGGDARAGLLVDHLLTPPPALEDRLPSGEMLPPSLRRLLDQLLAKKPEDRPDDAKDVVSTLDAIAAGRASVEVARSASPPPAGGTETAGHSLVSQQPASSAAPSLTPAPDPVGGAPSPATPNLPAVLPKPTAGPSAPPAPRERTVKRRSWPTRLFTRASPEERLLKKAQGKRRRWLSHLRAYIAVNTGLIAINILTAVMDKGPADPWSLMTIASWGMGLLWHGLSYRAWREEHVLAIERAAAKTGLPVPGAAPVKPPAPEAARPAPPALPVQEPSDRDPEWDALLIRCRRAVERAEEALAESGPEGLATEESGRALRDGLADVEKLAEGASRLSLALREVSPGITEIAAQIRALHAKAAATSNVRLKQVYESNRDLLRARQQRLEELEAEVTRMRVRAEGFALAAENVRLDAARLGAPKTSELSAGLADVLDQLDDEVEVMQQVEAELKAL